MKFTYTLLCLFLSLLVTVLLTSPLYPEEAPSPGEPKEIADQAPPIDGIPTYVQKKIYKKIWKEKEVDFRIRFLCIGDMDGDGLNELISTDGNQLRIVRWKYGKFRPLQNPEQEERKRFFFFWPRHKENGRKPLDEINKLNRKMEYLSLSLADLDGDERDEILFTGLMDHKLYSGIVEYEKGEFSQKMFESGLYLRTFHDKGGRPLLVGQALHSEKKEVYHYFWDGASFQKGEPFLLPEGVKIFSADSYRSSDPAGPAYVSFDNPGELRFFSPDLKEVAKLDSLQSPSQRKIRVRLRDASGETVKKRFRIPRRFLAGDFNGDGEDEVLLILNRPVFNLLGFRTLLKRKVVVNLVYSNGHILELWDTEPIFREILDQAIGDVDNDGEDDLVLITPKGLFPYAKRTQLLIYKLD